THEEVVRSVYAARFPLTWGSICSPTLLSTTVSVPPTLPPFAGVDARTTVVAMPIAKKPLAAANHTKRFLVICDAVMATSDPTRDPNLPMTRKAAGKRLTQ